MFKVLNHQGNANQNDPEITFIPDKVAKIKKKKKKKKNSSDTTCWSKEDIPPLLVGVHTYTATRCKSIWQVHTKLEIILPQGPFKQLLDINQKRCSNISQ
jgi:hypothetical protein